MRKRVRLKVKAHVTLTFTGRALEEVRERAGLSQQDLADRLNGYLGWSQPNISIIESASDEEHLIDRDMLQRVNKALNPQ